MPAPKQIEWFRDGDCFRCTSHYHNLYGYPQIERGKKRHSIARMIVDKRFQRAGQILPKEIVTRHTCDHEWCIRPDHLIHGTQFDNVHDMISRGRKKPVQGMAAPNAKISDEDVRFIRSSPETQTDLAKQFGIHVSTISRIKARIRWAHVTEESSCVSSESIA